MQQVREEERWNRGGGGRGDKEGGREEERGRRGGGAEKGWIRTKKEWMKEGREHGWNMNHTMP